MPLIPEILNALSFHAHTCACKREVAVIMTVTILHFLTNQKGINTGLNDLQMANEEGPSLL